MLVNKKNLGITVIELLLAISILGVFSYFGLTGLASYNAREIHKTETDKIISVLNSAKNKAKSGENARNYAVFIDGNLKRLTLFKVEVDQSEEDYSEIFNLNPKISLSTDADNGNVLFKRFTGESLNGEVVNIVITTDIMNVVKTSTIQVLENGLATTMNN